MGNRPENTEECNNYDQCHEIEKEDETKKVVKYDKGKGSFTLLDKTM